MRQESEELCRQIKKSKRLERDRDLKVKIEQEREDLKLKEQMETEVEALARWEARKLESANSTSVIEDLNSFSDDLINYRAKAKQMKKV